jgi:hypothetical protein
MIRIFGIPNSAVFSDLNPGVLYVLEAEFLQERKQVGQKPEICRQLRYVGLSINVSAE